MKPLAIFTTLLFVLVTGHFIVSSYHGVIGANYTIESPGYIKERDRLACGGFPVDDCVHSCPYNISIAPLPARKGFPFATNDFSYGISCGYQYTSFRNTAFIEAQILNCLYLLGITALYIFALRKINQK